MRELLTVPNPVLLRACEPIGEINSDVIDLANELTELMGTTHYGKVPLSISAPQIGVSLRMFAYRINPYSGLPGQVRVIINPTLTFGKKSVPTGETCLSIPGKSFTVVRHKIVKLKGMNIYGKYCSYKETGIVAQMFQHELNHLDGVLIDSIGKPMTGGG